MTHVSIREHSQLENRELFNRLESSSSLELNRHIALPTENNHAPPPRKVVVAVKSELFEVTNNLNKTVYLWGKTYSFVFLLSDIIFTPQPLRAVGVLFSPMVSGWAGGQAAGKSLSGLYLRNHKV